MVLNPSDRHPRRQVSPPQIASKEMKISLRPRRIREILMVWHHFLLVIRVLLHPHEIVNVFETGGHDAVVIGHVGELWPRDLRHESASCGCVVGLLTGSGDFVSGNFGFA